MRCFIAIDVDRRLLDRIAQFQREVHDVGADVKFVETQNLHFTVKFLGDVNENELRDIETSLRECVKNEHSFTINIEGLNYFGNSGRIRTLWFGVKGGYEELLNLVKVVNEKVKIGEREGLPHLTIGRVRSERNNESLLGFVNENKNVKIGEMNVNNIKLRKSTLTVEGPIYNDMAVFNLVS